MHWSKHINCLRTWNNVIVKQSFILITEILHPEKTYQLWMKMINYAMARNKETSSLSVSSNLPFLTCI
uniref:Uncharacterized protein n=1 Tax=Rhizophora mucronata TaxID=61149 RepID=A0A2P2QFW4_RHIMU